ncbi:MAG TPA: ABC transporter substrate-binding protein [Tepiditoga sp.]|nr:ABC transporter substrate-binding protein [Thermotogota bacterium]HOO74316.1 ABC transporter substrate-binding protein [Tepiditoga sp.]
MKKALTFLLVIIVAAAAFAVNGGYPDKIYFSVKNQEEIAARDVAEGVSDVFLQSVPGSIFYGLDKSIRDKLDVYSVPAGSWALFVNNIPNVAPYQVTVNDTTYFNPMAIQQVRFALNYLINRKYVVDEIQSGAAQPRYTQATVGQPNAYKINLVADKFGFTPEGNQEKAFQMIDEAMAEAAKDPANKGRLVKGNQFWMFDGEPVTIKFIIRVDDPEGRLKLGNYVSDLIEASGIKVERLLYERSKASNIAYYEDPALYNWNIYTEGWGGGDTYVWWYTSTMQYYTSLWGFQPGGATEGWWNFVDEEADYYANKAYTGKVLTEEEYWDCLVKATELGLQDATRIFVTDEMSFFVANKDRFTERMPYGLGNGLNRLSTENAKVKDNILRTVQFAAKGGLFMSTWDPVGADGFSDLYSGFITDLVFDRTFTNSPFGESVPLRAYVISTDNKVEKDAEGNLVGLLDVPADAVNYNHVTKSWEPVGEGVKAFTTTTAGYKWGKWHHGRDFNMDDIIYAQAFAADWTYKEDASDKEYDSSFAEYWKDTLENVNVGFVFNADDTITSYFDYNFPPDRMTQAISGILSPKVMGASKDGYSVPWELTEALALLVTEGSESGTIYGFTQDGDIEEVDLKNLECVDDIKAKLQDMISEKHVPASLADRVTPDEAVADYKLVLDFINKYGHPVIGMGPYYIAKMDFDNDFIELDAFRDGYPIEQGSLNQYLYRERLRIDRIEIPEFAMGGMDLEFGIKASVVEFPSEKSELAEKGDVKLIIATDQGERTFDAKLVSPGNFKVNVDATELYDINPGTYTVIVTATLDGFTSTQTSSLLFY